MAGKISTIKRQGSRLYVHPETGEKAPGVTSVVGMVPKEFLRYWGQKLVAEEAVDNLGAVVGLALNGGREAAVDMLKRAPDRFTKKSAELGSDAHDLFERMALGLSVPRVHPDLQPFVTHFGAFLDRYQPEFLLIEESVWSEKHVYAGSFDAFAKIEGEVVAVDWKTTRSGVHSDVALQLSAYRFADYVVRGDGTQVPLPKTTGGAVVHVRPEGWNFHPIKCDEAVFDYFVHLRAVFDWVKSVEKTVVGDPINESAEHVGASYRRGR